MISRAYTETDFAAMLAMNNAHAVELSPADEAGFRRVLAAASFVRVCGAMDAFLIGMDSSDPYHGLNFAWFRERYEDFAYVDRVCVAAHARGRGLARALYEDFCAEARARNLSLLCAEVNVVPPNDASNAFHNGMGFVEVGRVSLPAAGKVQRYVVRKL